MTPFDVSHPEVREAVSRALSEDIGSGDITSQLTVRSETRAHGIFVAQQEFVLAAIELLPLIYELRGGHVEVKLRRISGERVKNGTVLATVRGNARKLLECERVALNFVQRLSGVATVAGKYAAAVAGTKARVLDSRRTTPGLRILEKMAAAAGGATHHPRGPFDAVLIKKNHITAAGGVRNALAATRSFAGSVEIEVGTRAELEAALSAGAANLLLDNLTPAEAREWIRYIDGRATVELSGGITLETIRAYAETGPDFISSGVMTHSALAVDIDFRLELEA